jgi:uncharacterized protein (DUF2225 family)
MSSLISVTDFEITKGKKFSNKSPIVTKAIRLMKQKRQFKIENNEEVIDPFQLMLVCYDILRQQERRGRKNNVK